MNVMERFVCNARVSSTLKIISIEVVSSAERVSFQTTDFFLLLLLFSRHHLSISPSLAYRKKSLYAHFFFSPSWFHCYLSVRMKSQIYAKMCTQKKGIEKPRTMMSSRRQWMQSGKKKLWKRTRAHWKRFCFSAYLAHFCHRLTFGHFGPLGNSVVVGRCCMQN